MADQNDGVPAGQENVDQPAEAAPSPLSAEQISQLVADALDSRIGGLQSSMDKNIAAVRKEFKQASMSEDELEDAREQELQDQVQQVTRERDALRAAQKYPEVFPIYEALLNAQTPEDQLQAIDKALKSAAGSQPTPETPAQPAEEPTPAVDANAPAPTQVGGVAASSGQMTSEKASRILDALQGTWNEALGRNS
jgi:hypothetical protein